MDMAACLDSWGDAAIWIRHAILLPHSLFHWLWQKFNGRFQELVAGMTDFWAGCSNLDPRVPGEVQDRVGKEHSAVPLLLHNDGIRYTHFHDSMDTLTWSMANVGKVERGSWNTIFLIITIAKRAVSCIPGNDTLKRSTKCCANL